MARTAKTITILFFSCAWAYAEQVTVPATPGSGPTVELRDHSTVAALRGLITMGTAPYSVTTYVRKITDLNFTPLETFKLTGTFLDVVPGITVTPADLGLEYYFKVTDALDRSDESPVGKVLVSFDPSTSPIFINHTFTGENDFRVIAIPLTLQSNLIQKIFESLSPVYDKSKYRIGSYNNGEVREFAQNAASPNTIERGQGYWFIAAGTVNLGVGAGSVADNSMSNPFKLTLVKGWNLIGNPYPFPIDWTDVKALNPEAKALSEVNFCVNGGYQIRTDKLIPSYEGGFVFADDATELILPVSLSHITGSGKHLVPTTSNALDNEQWVVDLTLEGHETVDQLPAFGMHPLAKVSRDAFDRLSPPVIANGVVLTTTHTDFFYPTFSCDIVPTSDSYTWRFVAAPGSNKGDVILRWSNNGFESNDAQLFLFNVSTAEFINMKAVSSYQFELNEPTELRIYFKNNSLTPVHPDVVMIGPPIPNPFTSEFSINVILADRNEPYFVNVSIFDIMGRNVTTLFSGTLPSGFNKITWNDDATSVSSGVYIIRTTIEGQLTSSMQVVRK